MALFNGPTKDPDASNATILLKTLQKTIIFEKDVSSALQREYGVLFRDEKDAEKAIKLSPSKKNDTKNIENHPDTNVEDGRAPSCQEPVDPLLGIASSAFDKYMRPYIALEEKSMDEQLVSALEDRTVDTRGNHPVFISSTKLFVYIKGSITRCTALTKGNTFFLLHKAFRDSLCKYSQVLSSKLPTPLPQKSVGPLNMPPVPFANKQHQDTNPSQTASYRVPLGEEITVCHVIGTCEYCAETVEALEDLIKDIVDEQFKSKIDMMGTQEGEACFLYVAIFVIHSVALSILFDLALAFHDITAKSIRILVSGMESRLEDPLKTMTLVNWAVFAEVGEESDYVRDIHKEIQPFVSTARDLIPKSYFQSFCDKFAYSFTAIYYDNLVRLIEVDLLCEVSPSSSCARLPSASASR